MTAIFFRLNHSEFAPQADQRAESKKDTNDLSEINPPYHAPIATVDRKEVFFQAGIAEETNSAKKIQMTEERYPKPNHHQT